MTLFSRAIADTSSGVILASVTIAAPPMRVFTALTSAEITQWWGAPGFYRTTGWQADVRVGGAWQMDGVGRDDSPYCVRGQFVELDPPRRLVMTWQPEWDAFRSTTVTFTLAEVAGGTQLTLRHEGFADRPEMCQSHGDGWQNVLGWLANYLRTEPPLQSFLCRLLPPRPTFALDMTPEERAMMGAHAAYWQRLMATGRVAVIGLVLDPAGPWGMGVVRARDVAELTALQSDDPAIAQGRGLRYENLPMPVATWPTA